MAVDRNYDKWHNGLRNIGDKRKFYWEQFVFIAVFVLNSLFSLGVPVRPQWTKIVTPRDAANKS